MNDDDHSARLIRLEITQEQHSELLQRVVTAIEAQAIHSERLAHHIDESKRVWLRLEDHDERLASLQTQNAEVCAFCTSTRKLGWAVAFFLSGGLAYLIKFYFDHHASH